jgi:RNA recognition motif-containing protein
MYNNYELYIGKIQPDADGYELQRLFHKKGIRFISLDVKNKEGGKGFGFMKCLTEKDLAMAVQMNGEISYGGKRLELRVAAERKKDKGGDRDHKKNHHHGNNRNYEN